MNKTRFSFLSLLLVMSVVGAIAEDDQPTGFRIFDARQASEETRLAISVDGTPVTADMIPGETTFVNRASVGAHSLDIFSAANAEGLVKAEKLDVPNDSLLNIIVIGSGNDLKLGMIPISYSEAKSVKNNLFVFFNSSAVDELHLTYRETPDDKDQLVSVAPGKWVKLPVDATFSKVSFIGGGRNAEIAVGKFPRAEILAGKSAIFVLQSPSLSDEVRVLNGINGTFISEDN